MPLTAVKISGNSDKRSEAEKLQDMLAIQADYGKSINSQPQYPKWDYKTLRQQVLDNNPWFVLDQYNQQEFELLCLYFSGDPRFEQGGRTFSKGIGLYGPIGCGKTTIMRLFQVNTFRPFGVVRCRKISDMFASGGVEVLNQYANMQRVYAKHHIGFDFLGRCYDDLGKEEIRNNFGNQLNVMVDIIEKIYEFNRAGHFHMITNVTGNQIETFYGPWIKSRMRSLFNLIQFNKNSPDRRK